MEQPDTDLLALCDRIDARLKSLSHTFAEIDRALEAAIAKIDHALRELKREQS